MSTVQAGPFEAAAVVLDVEGTLGSLSHVREVLFPYARRRLAGWVRANWASARHSELRAQTRELTGNVELDEAGAIAALTDWSERDVKAPPLKAVQALIWAEGYADGSLFGHVYPEVPAALASWRRQGIARYIYSSGAIGAQRDWFARSDQGDLSALLDGYFDLTNAGDKRDAQSYRRIAAAIGASPGLVLFLSDSTAELDAAALAGWQAVGVRRAGDLRGASAGAHPTIDSLDAVSVRSIRLTERRADGNRQG